MDFLPIPISTIQGATLNICSPAHAYGPDFSYKLVLSNGNSSITKTSSTGKVTVSAAETLGMTVGKWGFYWFADAGSESYLIQKGVFDVEQSPETANPDFDPRSSAAKMLEQYNSLLTSASFIKTLDPNVITELESFRKQLEWDVKRERDAEKLKRSLGGHSNKIYTRFV